MKKMLVLSVCLAVVSAAQGFIIENRAGGQNVGLWSQSGWANSSGNVNAPGCTLNIGCMYSGTTVYFGPGRMGIFSFTPTETSDYQIDLAWPSTAGQLDTAVVVFTGASTGGPNDAWGNSGPVDVVANTTMDMNYKNNGVWNTAFAAVPMTAGTTYKLGIYGGHMSLNAAPDPSNRVSVGAAQFTAVPEPVTALMLAVGGLLLRRRHA